MLFKLFSQPAADVLQLEHFAWLLGREPRPQDLTLAPVRSQGELARDSALVPRVMEAYRRSMGEFQRSGSFWDGVLFDLKKDIHDALAGDNVSVAADVLQDPSKHTHFWGFDAIAKAPTGETEPHELVIKRLNTRLPWERLYALWILDAVKNLAEAVGAKRLAYPEIDVKKDLIESRMTIEELLNSIADTLNTDLRFPNPYPDELGLQTTRGIVGFRAVQALYQAWRIRCLARQQADFRVLEIGAGLGRTAFFALQLGLRDYTIIDIPLTNAAQGYFLGRTLGDDQVQLHGELGAGPVRVLPTASGALEERYDLVVNVDSFAEMAEDVARSYWNFSKTHSRQLLSINHEYNQFTVRDIYVGEPGIQVSRHPYWMRRGYVEELITFPQR